MNDDQQHEENNISSANDQTAGTQSVDPTQQLQSQCEEYLNGWRRAKADYANLQKETEEYRKSFGAFVIAQTVSEIIPIVDHLDEAMRHIPETLKGTPWAVGMEHIRRQIDDWFKGKGIEAMEVIGTLFDPAKEEAVEKRADPEHANMVVEVIQKGYMLHGKVLRPAKVIIGE